MRKSLLYTFSISIFVFLSSNIQAQYPGSVGNSAGGKNVIPGGDMPKGMSQKAGFGRIYGKVIDSKTKKGVEFASVAIYFSKNDSLAGGQLTESNGDFSLDNLPPAAYNLKISYIGYKVTQQKVTVAMINAEQDIGNITLEDDEKMLNAVTITAEKSAVELKPDRKVFNVDKDLSAKGGTGVDVMKNIPGVSTDADGNVTLRNNTPIVYVDGKPTTLTLEQIPADQIDKVEVITNPSAKFEAASTGGIINVILKKNQKPGYNGILTLAVGTNSQYNGMALINVREKKFGFMLSYNINGNTNRTAGYTDRANLYNGIANSFSHQDDNVNSRRLFQVARVGFDYYINNRNTLSFSQNGTFGNFNTTSDQVFSQDTGAHIPVSKGTRVTNQDVSFRNFTTDLNFRHTYPKGDKEWTLDINYNHSNGGNNYIYNFNNYSANDSFLPYNLPGNPQREYSIGSSHSDMITAQWDFVDPIGKNMKLEFGVRANYQHQVSVANVVDSAYSEGQPNTALSNNYRIDNLINGAYVTFSHTVKKFSYQIGLRAEETYYKAVLPDMADSSFSYQYPSSLRNIYEVLFPSLNISQKFSDKHELQFNVTRKIKRPNFFQLNPFVFASDKFSYQTGNPQLQPEFNNKAEINYNLYIKGFNWLSSLYGSYNEHPITQYSYTQPGDSLVLVNTFVNSKNSFTYGWENTFKIAPVKGLDITADGNVFYTTINSSITNEEIHNSGISWTAKGIISYKFPLGINAQINGTYEAPRIIPQGHTLPLYFFDFSISKDFGIVALNFTVSDVLNSKTHGTYYDTPTYIQTQTRRRDMRYARLGMTIKFGKMDSSLFGKKKKKSQDPGSGGEDIEY